jgi:hypothetical protein
VPLDLGYVVHEFDLTHAGLASATALRLIAQTASVLDKRHKHMWCSRYPEQLLFGFARCFRSINNEMRLNYPTFISFITGPSRTGAHGSKKLTIRCISVFRVSRRKKLGCAMRPKGTGDVALINP